MMAWMQKKKGPGVKKGVSMSSENDRCYSWTRTIPDTLNKKKRMEMNRSIEKEL